jgi:hypothetical protein
MRYRVEQRIQTLAHNAVMKDGRMEAAFSVGPRDDGNCVLQSRHFARVSSLS